MKKRTFRLTGVVVSSLGAIALAGAVAESETGFSPWVDDRGGISLPTEFRAHWAHLGSWAVKGADGSLSLHDVYTEPEALRHFVEHAEFPDGAPIVKEVRSGRSAVLTTGSATWAAQPEVWFVMIKDARGRFAGHPLWGDGWGWALFEADDPGVTVTEDYSHDCIPCHVPAQDTDWVYVYGYPSLGLSSAPPADAGGAATRMTGVSAEMRKEPVVEIEKLAFAPREIVVEVGATITWMNRDGSRHSATSDGAEFDTGEIASGDEAQITFEEAGTFAYHCTPHPFMRGTVVVRSKGAAGSASR